MRARRALTKRARETKARLLELDGSECAYCGLMMRPSRLTFDHVRSLARGGTNEVANLVLSCAPCNRIKGAKPLDRLDIPHARRLRAWVRAIAGGDDDFAGVDPDDLLLALEAVARAHGHYPRGRLLLREFLRREYVRLSRGQVRIGREGDVVPIVRAVR